MRYLLALGLLLSWLFTSAQKSEKLSGKIYSVESNELLIGAIVQIEGTNVGTVTDVNGRFDLPLSGVKEEQVTIRYRFLGYEDLLETYTLSEISKPISIKLKLSNESLNEVVVSGRFEGQQLALYQQKEAVNVKNVISSEQIKEFPDVNAAEAIQRIPGITLQRDQGEGRYVQLRGTPPELTNFNINGEQIPSPEGDVRYVGLDVIAADQIESIEITKALTPDMDGDGIGGNVNIVTKSARDTIPEIKASIAGGYNEIVDDFNAQGTISYGQRIGKFGFHVNGNFYQNNQGAHNMEFDYLKIPTEQDTNFNPVTKEIELRHYTITRQRIGLSSTLDYQFSENSKVYIKGIYNQFSDDEVRRRVTNDFGSGRIVSENKSLEAKIERDVRARLKIQRINTINVGGEHDIFGAKLDYMMSYALATEEEPNTIEMGFQSQFVDMELDLKEPSWPLINYPGDANNMAAHNYESYEFDELLVSKGSTRDQNITYKVNLQIPLNPIKGEVGYFKFGTRIRDKDKQRDKIATVYDNYYEIFLPDDRQIYLQQGPPLSLQTVGGEIGEDNMFNRGYDLGMTPDPTAVRGFIEFYEQNFKIAEAATKQESFGEDYSAKEFIRAYYGMYVQEFRKWKFLGGVRYEQTDVVYQGNEIVVYKGRFFESLEPLKSEKTYRFLLPQFHLRYRMNPTTNIKGAATYTFSRPNFEDILPYRQESNDEVTFGNPDLQFPEAFNLDLMFEKYISANGLLSFGLFYKNIENFIFYYKRFVHLDSSLSTSGLKEVTMANNGNKAYVYGFEVNANFKFKFFDNFLSNFGLYSNYTYTHSDAYIQERTPVESLDEVFIYNPGGGNQFVTESGNQEVIPLPGQAPHSLNLALFYDKKQLFIKLASNYQSAFLHELGQEPDFDVYYDQAFRLDFTADYRITKHIGVFVQALNLTDTPLKLYMGEPDRLKQQEYYSWSARAGIRITN